MKLCVGERTFLNALMSTAREWIALCLKHCECVSDQVLFKKSQIWNLINILYGWRMWDIYVSHYPTSPFLSRRALHGGVVFCLLMAACKMIRSNLCALAYYTSSIRMFCKCLLCLLSTLSTALSFRTAQYYSSSQKTGASWKASDAVHLSYVVMCVWLING